MRSLSARPPPHLSSLSPSSSPIHPTLSLLIKRERAKGRGRMREGGRETERHRKRLRKRMRVYTRTSLIPVLFLLLSSPDTRSSHSLLCVCVHTQTHLLPFLPIITHSPHPLCCSLCEVLKETKDCLLTLCVLSPVTV